jgi:hypothetical protein
MKHEQHKGVINYFVEYNSIFSLTPWRNSIQLFYDEGYKINVYQYVDTRIKDYPTSLEDKYTLISIPYPDPVKYILFGIKMCFRSLKYLGLTRASTFGDGIDFLFRNYYFIAICLLRNKCGEKEVFIGGDPGGLIVAYYLANKKRGTLIYWSLELYIEKDLRDFGLKIVKRRERKCSQNALCTVDFGDIRCKVLQGENGLDPKTMISIPNSQIGPGRLVRNYYFNDKFEIPRDRIIILHAGALYSPSLRVKDIFSSVPDWPDNYVLVLHTHQRPYPMSGFRIPQEYINKRIFLSDTPVPFDQLELIYSSCDIGIMVHGPTGTDFDLNLYYSDLSIGKMFQHLKVGVPVIVRNLPGYSDLIEGKGVGVCIDQPSDILSAINRIVADHKKYRLNAVKLHDELRFELHHKKLSDRINVLRG